MNLEHYRNGLAYAHGYARAYGFTALLRVIRNPTAPPSLATTAPDFHVGAIDAALAMVSADPRLGVTRG